MLSIEIYFYLRKLNRGQIPFLRRFLLSVSLSLFAPTSLIGATLILQLVTFHCHLISSKERAFYSAPSLQFWHITVKSGVHTQNLILSLGTITRSKTLLQFSEHYLEVSNIRYPHKYSCSSAISTLAEKGNKRPLQTLSIDNTWSNKNFLVYLTLGYLNCSVRSWTW